MPPEGVDLHVAGERTEYVMGVDLGQKRDHTAIAILERSDVIYSERDALTWAHFEKTEYRLRFLKRLELGLTYPQIVEKVETIVRALQKECGSWGNRPSLALVVDETGVGTAVVDLLRRCGLGCELVPVTITPGEREVRTKCGWNVPKRELVTGLQVMYENDELLMSGELNQLDVLLKELAEMQVRRSPTGHESFAVWREGVHDDLVLAVALAVWRARKGKRSPWGTVRLI
jgi:hypothetical protein